MHRYAQTDTDTTAALLLEKLTPSETGATILALSGELGAGKTTLTQALARALGVMEDVQSPTFVVMKSYAPTKGSFIKLVHMDAYRIDSLDELGPLKFEQLLSSPNTLLVIEWPERIEGALPQERVSIHLEHDSDHRILRHA